MDAALSKKEWAEIANAGNLPREAKVEIEAVLGWFKDFMAIPNTSGRQVAARLNLFEKHIKALQSELRGLMAAPHIRYALTENGRFSLRRDGLELFANLDAMLSGTILVVDASIAKESRDRAKPGAANSAGHLEWLVTQLDLIHLRFGGRGLSRSNKRPNTTRAYVTAAVHAVSPEVGKGSIERAMMRVIKGRRQRATITPDSAPQC